MLFLLFEFAIRWNNLVFLLPSLKQSALDFCLQLTYFRKINFSKSLEISSFLHLSSSNSDLPSTIISRSRIPSKRSFFLLPNITINLFIQNKTWGALKTIGHPPLFHFFSKKTFNFTTLSNLKYQLLLITSPQSSNNGKWFDKILGSLLWEKSGNRASQSRERINLLILDQDKDSRLLDHVKYASVFSVNLSLKQM